MSAIKDSLKAFLSSAAFQTHISVANARAEAFPALKQAFGGFIRSEVSLDDLRRMITGSVDAEVMHGDEPLPLWGFGGRGTAQFFDALVDAADPNRLEAELRQALTSVDLSDPTPKLRSFASFVAQTARAAQLGPESNLHVGYATCFLTFGWHVVYDLEVPVFYGSSHKGMKALLGAGVVEEPDYASRDLGLRFRAFLRITRGLRDLLRRVNPALNYWTIDIFLEWFSTRRHVEDSGVMARVSHMPAGGPSEEAARPARPARSDAMSTMATIDPKLVAAARAMSDDDDDDDDFEEELDDGDIAEMAAAAADNAPAWYDGKVQAGEVGVTRPPTLKLDAAAFADVPLQSAGKLKLPSFAPRAPGIPGLDEYDVGQRLLDSTAGAGVMSTDTSNDLGDDYLEQPGLRSSAFEVPPELRDSDDGELDLDIDDDDLPDLDDDDLPDLDDIVVGSSTHRDVMRSPADIAAPSDPSDAEEARPARPPASTGGMSPLTGRRSGPLPAPAARGPEDLIDRVAAETLLDPALVGDVIEVLRSRRQVLIEGRTGTGKTLFARRLALALAGSADRTRVLQVHPALTYEHVIETRIPGAAPGAHGAAPGLLKAFAEAAHRSPTHRYVIVFDDVGRGDLVSILGECFSLLDHRDEEVMLPISRTAFALPPNLYVIATASTEPGATVDDVSLRRRFPSVTLEPDADVLRRFLKRSSPDLTWLADAYAKLNDEIAEELGPNHRLGHGRFMRANLDAEGLDRLWRFEVAPALTGAGLPADRVSAYAFSGS